MAKLEPGARVDRYEVVGLLGQGGQAVVYEVRDVRDGTRHALKVLAVDRPQLVARFRREGEIQAALQHPHIVAASAALEVEGGPALVLELVDGLPLDGWLHAHPGRAEAVNRRLARQILGAMAYAHARGAIHRDLKPANVLVTGPDHAPVAKVTDFTLAKLLGDDGGVTKPGIGMGSPRYTAPEQIRDARSVDARADVFALGCVIYEIWTGRQAFDQPGLLEILEAIQTGDWALPEGVPDDVAAAIRGALEVDPGRRIASAAELLALLADQPESPGRRWVGVGGAALLAGTLLIVGAAACWGLAP